MSRCCDDIQRLLVRVHEGEATPDQAMHVARHLADCTACRIARAREKRLAEMLSSDLEDLAVGEDFVDAVMATLPRELPKRDRNASAGRNWRGLKLASFAGFGMLSLLPGASGVAGFGLPARALPRFGADGAALIQDGLPGMARIVAVAADSLAGGIALQAPSLAIGLGVLAGLALCGLIAVAGASAMLALATR